MTFSRHELDPQSGYRNVYSNFVRSYKYAYGSMFKAEQQFTRRQGARWHLTAGGTAERFFSIPQGADLGAPVRSHDEPGLMLGTNIRDDFFKLHYSNFGAYLQGKYEWAPSLNITLGARGDRNSRFGGTFNPRVGLIWTPDARSEIKLLYGTAYLAATPFQAYSHYGGFLTEDGGKTYYSPFWHLPNPDLKPQHKWTTDVSVRRSVTRRVDVWGSAFYSRFSNLIVEGLDKSGQESGFYKGWPVDFIQVSVNGGEETTTGGSAGIDVVQSWSAGRRPAARLSGSLADGRIGGLDKDAPEYGLETGGFAPAQLHMTVDFKWDGWSVSPRLLMIGTQRLMATTETPAGLRRMTINGYDLVDMNIRRRLIDAATVFVTVENALDRRHRHINLRAISNPEEFVGAPQNPRRVTIGLDLRLP